MWWFLVLGGLYAAQAFVAAPIAWGTHAPESFFLTPRALPLKGTVLHRDLILAQDVSNSVMRMSSKVPYFTVHSKTIRDATGQCVEAGGDVVRLNECNGRPSQLWNFLPSGRGRNIQIQLEGTSRCLDVDEKQSGVLGPSVKLGHCEARGTQLWKFAEPRDIPTQDSSPRDSSIAAAEPHEMFTLLSSGRSLTYSCITVAVLVFLSVSAWLWRWQLMPVRHGGLPFSVDQGGAALIAVRRDAVPLAPKYPAHTQELVGAAARLAPMQGKCADSKKPEASFSSAATELLHHQSTVPGPFDDSPVFADDMLASTAVSSRPSLVISGNRRSAPEMRARSKSPERVPPASPRATDASMQVGALQFPQGGEALQFPQGAEERARLTVAKIAERSRRRRNPSVKSSKKPAVLPVIGESDLPDQVPPASIRVPGAYWPALGKSYRFIAKNDATLEDFGPASVTPEKFEAASQEGVYPGSYRVQFTLPGLDSEPKTIELLRSRERTDPFIGAVKVKLPIDMIVEPDPFNYPSTWRILVRKVEAGSNAEESGIMVGDIVRAVSLPVSDDTTWLQKLSDTWVPNAEQGMVMLDGKISCDYALALRESIRAQREEVVFLIERPIQCLARQTVVDDCFFSAEKPSQKPISKKEGAGLSVDEEQAYGYAVQKLMAWKKVFGELKNNFNREPTVEEWAKSCGFITTDAFSAALRIGEVSKSTMVLAHVRLVHSISHKMKDKAGSGYYKRDDLVQEGMIGLIRAAERFDPNRAARFSTYAYSYITFAMMDASQNFNSQVSSFVRTQMNAMKRARHELQHELGRAPYTQEIAEKTGFTEDKIQEMLRLKPGHIYSSDATPVAAIADQKGIDACTDQLINDTIRGLLEKFTPRQRNVFMMREGLVDGTQRSWKEISESEGVSTATAQNVHALVMWKLQSGVK